MKVAIYCRVSVADKDKEKQRDSESIDTQETRCRQHADAAGLEVVRVYKDDGKSGGTLNRPALQELLADSQAGKFEGVLFTRLDRLSRTVLDTSTLLKTFRLAGIAAMPLDDKIEDTASGNMTVNVKATFAQFFRELTRENTLKSLEKRAKQGLWNGGASPLGYRRENKQLVIDEQTAAIVRELFQTYFTTNSLRQTALAMNRKGYATRSGCAWCSSTVQRVLSNRVYLGIAEWRGIACENAHPAIIDAATFEAVQTLLQSHSKPTRRGVKFLLRGLVRCGACGHRFQRVVSRKDGYEYEYLMCCAAQHRQGCTAPAVRMDALEQVVIDNILQLSQDEQFLIDKAAILHAMREVTSADQQQARLDALETRAAAAARKVERLLRLFEQADIDEQDLLPRYQAAKQERAAIQQQIEEAKKAVTHASAVLDDMEQSLERMQSFGAGWESLNFEQQRERLLTVLEEIVLTRGEAEIVLKIDNLSLLEGISHVSRILPHVQHMNRTDSPAIMTEYYALNVPIERRRRSM